MREGSLIAGRYRVGRQLGEGGMGTVFEAVDVGTGRRVALKLILDMSARGSDTLRRFEREARAAAAIDTDHIVKVLDSGEDGETGNPYLVMELLEGEDLAHVVERLGALPVELALRVATQAALGLEKAHRSGIVHRDIKPANLFLAQREGGELVVKVLDFGIAKVKADPFAQGHAGGITRTGSMVGSPLYMSPEQMKGRKDIDGRADVWSLGVVLYEALTGRAPHRDAGSFGLLILAICNEAPRPVQDLAPWVPPEVARVVHRALRIDRSERYPSMSEMLADLSRALPAGAALHESMLAPLAADARAQVAERSVVSSPAPVRGGSTQPLPGAPRVQGGSTQPLPGAPPVPHAPGRPRSRE